ncbi:MAG TPA: phenylalanine--tRNA ligase subunit alpha [Vicinamibacterales bacterium]
MTPTDTLRAQFTDEIAAARTDRDLKAIRDRYLGRKGGAIAALMKTLASAPAEERPALGQAINALKREIEAALDARAAALAATARPAGAVDVTLPGRVPPIGGLHPLTQLRTRIEAIFARQGYEILSGPETEDDWHNFEALNMPPDHPARDMQDTLYLSAPWNRSVPPVGSAARSDAVSAPSDAHDVGSPKKAARSGGASAPPDTRPATLLRTHTSAMQIRYMETHRPPVRVIAPGRVYRRDNLDLTHTPMFQQVEGLVVGEHVTMGDLKGTIIGFLRELFAPDIPVVFRPSFFPYTEPSADVFIGCQQCRGAGCAMCKRTGFIEVLGCGMVHPAVFEAVGYDPKAVTGFAFGVGIERLALLMYGVEDIRLFYENDLRFLEQFPL